MKLGLIFCPLLMLLTVMAPARAADDATPTPDSPHAKLEQILKRPEFTAWRLRQSADLPDIDARFGDRWLELIKRPFRAIGDFLDQLFRTRSGRAVRSPISGDSLSVILKLVMWAIVVVVAIFLAIVLVKVLGPGPAHQAAALVLSREQVRNAMESGDALALASGAWIDEARRLAAEQDFRAVYRALYLALLSGLHTAGKIEHNRNRTNWAYVQHYRGTVTERDRFSELTELFDRVWYGRKVAAHQDLESLQKDVALLTRSSGAA